MECNLKSESVQDKMPLSQVIWNVFAQAAVKSENFSNFFYRT